MSYIGSWAINDLLTFVCVTQVFATGVATDADAVPAYRVYEDETGTPILTGNMALLDSANTAGFYSEQITLSAANGFEKGKGYSIYIAATVSSIAGATHRTFQINDIDARLPAALTAGGNIKADALKVGGDDPATTADFNAEVVDALATDTYAEPGQGAPAATTSLAAKIGYIYKAFRNKKTQTATTFSLYADDAATVDQKQTVSDDLTTFTRGEMATGP